MNTLLYKYFRGETTEEEEDRIVEWTEADPNNLEAFLQERKRYDMILFSNRNERKHKIKTVFRHYLLPLIGAAIIALIFSVLAYNNYSKSLLSQTIRIPAGQRAQIELPDGTIVWLNSKTTLTYNNSFGGKFRTVNLDGEAYFEVAHDKKKPFIVKTFGYKVKVLGTVFNIKSSKENDFFETSLVSGSVEVSSIDTKKKYLLSPNHKIYTQNNSLLVSEINNSEEFRWREGLICFDDIRFGDLLNKLSSYYDITIILENESIKNIQYTGKFKQKDGIEYALKVLQNNLKFDYEKESDKNIIYIR